MGTEILGNLQGVVALLLQGAGVLTAYRFAIGVDIQKDPITGIIVIGGCTLFGLLLVIFAVRILTGNNKPAEPVPAEPEPVETVATEVKAPVAKKK